MKLKIINEFGNPSKSKKLWRYYRQIPVYGDKILEKNSVSVIDIDNGIVEVKLSDFDIQGLNPV